MENENYTKVLCRETEHRKVFYFDDHKYNTCCYVIENAIKPENPDLTKVFFQNRSVQENGVNGCQNEDLLAIVIHRLQGLQSGQFACQDYADALIRCQEVLFIFDAMTIEGRSLDLMMDEEIEIP